LNSETETAIDWELENNKNKTTNNGFFVRKRKTKNSQEWVE